MKEKYIKRMKNLYLLFIIFFTLLTTPFVVDIYIKILGTTTTGDILIISMNMLAVIALLIDRSQVEKEAEEKFE